MAGVPSLRSALISQISPALLRAALAEFIGVMLFQVFGGSTLASLQGNQGALVNGIALVICIYATAKISGGHLNPAVSTGLFVARKISVIKWAVYVVAQVLGGVAGALILVGLTTRTLDAATGKAHGCIGDISITGLQGLGWEMFMTFALVFVVFATAVDSPGFGDFAPLAIGLTIYAGAGSGGMLTGGYINPARLLGPAIVFACGWTNVPLFLIGELGGGVVAALLYKTMFLNKPRDDETEEHRAHQFATFDDGGSGHSLEVSSH